MLKPIRKVENNNGYQSGSNEHSKPGNSQSGIPGTSEGGCLMARIKTVQRFLEHQPQARPGICTILVGLTIFTLGLLLSFLGKIQPHWVAYSLVGVGLLVTFIGSLQLFLYFHNVNTKQQQRGNPTVASMENGKSPDDRRSDTIALSAAGRLELDPEICDQTVANNNGGGDSLAPPPHNHHKGASLEGSYVTQAYKIFLRFRDPLVLRTPTVINFKCEFEFPDGVDTTSSTNNARNSTIRDDDVITPLSSPTFADDVDADDVIRGRRGEYEEGGVLRFSADEVEETRA